MPLFSRAAPILFLIFLVLGIFLGQQLATTSDNSESAPAVIERSSDDYILSWQTYRDDNLGFRIRHPDNVVVRPRTAPGGGVEFLTKVDQQRERINRGRGIESFARMMEIYKVGGSGEEPVECWKRIYGRYAQVLSVRFNNAYGVMPFGLSQVQDFYLTDTKRDGPVVRVRVDSPMLEEDFDVSDFTAMITTFQFER